MCEEDAPRRRCRGGCPADPKTDYVDEYMVQQGFAKRVSWVGDTPEAVGHFAKDVGVYHDSAECTENGTPERPSLSVLPTRSEPTSDTRFPHGAEPSAVAKENLLEILVTCVLSPDCFYGQDVSRVEDQSLVQCLTAQCTKRFVLPTEIEAGLWYVHRELPEQCGDRVRVDHFNRSGTYSVFLPDYGSRKTVSLSSLFMVNPRLTVIAPLAKRLQLSGVQPQREWTEAAVQRFAELVHTGTPLTAVLVDTTFCEEVFVDRLHVVRLLSPTHGDVAECLVREGHAKPVPLPARPYHPVREEHSGPPRSPSTNREDPSVAASNLGFRRGHHISTPCTLDDGTKSRVSIGPAHSSKPAVIFYPALAPKVGSCVLGRVSAVFGPSCFYLVFPFGQRSTKRLGTTARTEREPLEALTRDLQDVCNERSFRGNSGCVAKAEDELVAAKSSCDGRWHRARVVSLGEQHMVKVFFLDLGYCEGVPTNGVVPLGERFTQLPPQTFQACLATDEGQNRLEHTWNDRQIEAFANAVSGKYLDVKVVDVTEGLLQVQLYFMNGEDLCSVSHCF